MTKTGCILLRKEPVRNVKFTFYFIFIKLMLSLSFSFFLFTFIFPIIFYHLSSLPRSLSRLHFILFSFIFVSYTHIFFNDSQGFCMKMLLNLHSVLTLLHQNSDSSVHTIVVVVVVSIAAVIIMAVVAVVFAKFLFHFILFFYTTMLHY